MPAAVQPPPGADSAMTENGPTVRRSSRLGETQETAQDANLIPSPPSLQSPPPSSQTSQASSQASASGASKRQTKISDFDCFRRASQNQEDDSLDAGDLFSQPAYGGDSDSDYKEEPPVKRRKVSALPGSTHVASRREDKKESLIVTLRLPVNSVESSSTHFIPARSLKIPKSKQNALVKQSKATVTRRPKAKTEIADIRPLPWGHPQVWADTRAELADALPYFNCYQGSSATLTGKVKGMLLDEDFGDRSLIGEEIVIARAGGSFGADEATGLQMQKKDQNIDNFRIQSFRNNMDRKLPLQLIVGSKNLQCPSRIPFRYCVMGGFHITYVWAEKSHGCVIYKFRLQKVDLCRKSWWASANSKYIPVAPNTETYKATSKDCSTCHQNSKQVYKRGWMCLNAQCVKFWKIRGEEVKDADLEFDGFFLAERTEAPEVEAPYPTVPNLIKFNTGEAHEKTLSVTRQCWKGIVCPNCGRCNQRRDWDLWKCLAVGCEFEHSLPRAIIPASAVMGDLDHAYEGHALSDDKWIDTLVSWKPSTYGFFKVHHYKLPHDNIRITHIHSNKTINAKAGGADDIFESLQTASIGLQRLPIKVAPVSGLVSAHFSKNFGLPYDYVLDHPELSTSFEDAPHEIKEAMRRLLWAGQHGMNNKEKLVLNECLAVGYFEGQSMGYHDDGEDSLGSDVVSWSLGCPASMRFRLKAKYYTGFSKNKSYHAEYPVLPTCYKPEVREELNKMAKRMSSEELTIKAKVLLKGHPTNCPVLLDLKLRHGDFMSMHGYQMQKYYEHEVVPTHELRFALTGRYVKPEKVDKSERSKGDLNLDPKDAYDGDLQVFQDWKKEQDAVLDKAAMRYIPPSASAGDDHAMTDAL